MIVTRHESAASFLETAEPMLMLAEAENNVIIGVAQGIARSPGAAKNPYMATVTDAGGSVLASAIYLPPSKLVVTRANREPIVALAKHAFESVPTIEGVTGPDR